MQKTFVSIAVFVVSLLAAAVPARAQTPARGWVEAAAVSESEEARPGSIVRLALQARIADGFHIQSNRPLDESLIPARLFLDTPRGASYLDVAFPPSIDFAVAGQPAKVFEGTVLVGARVRLAEDQPGGTLTIPGHFRYQACDDRVCYKPATADVTWTIRVVGAPTPVRSANADLFRRIDFRRAEPPPTEEEAAAFVLSPRPPSPTGSIDVLALFDQFEIAGTGQYMNVPEFLQFIRDAESGVTRRGPFEDRGPVAILTIVFLGGLALNLTPCVLPMIPINLAIIGAGAQSRRRGRGFVLGATYGGAMAAVYGLLGLIVILTAGTFGAINSSIWFNAAIASLFVVLGLAMFDLVAIDFSRWSNRIRFDPQSRGTLLLAFGMGAVAALLAGACVAPVVIQVVVFASDLYASGAPGALALPFVLGLGMALPWPIAGAGLASLPKPGPWMVRVKHALGVFILATAAYYAYTAYQIAASRWVDPASVRAGVEAQLKEGWHGSLADGLQAARRDRTLVLVDFWATWCKNCLVMDKTTLQDPAVKAALAKYTKIKVQAEDLDASPTKELLQRVGSYGLPTYVILRPE